MNVIWIVSDTLRRDHLGCYGNKWIHTPEMDKLAQKSTRFDRFYSASFPTGPTRSDHATGRWTGVFTSNILPKEQVTLAQILNRAGYYTAAVVDTPFYRGKESNAERGFRKFIEVPGQSDFVFGGIGETRDIWRNEEDRFAAKTFTEAGQLLEKHYKENFFLYVDVWDPHELWDAPNHYTELYYPGFDGAQVFPLYGKWKETPGFTEEMLKKAHATYCGEITMVDTWLGQFLRKVENMQLLENTAIIFTTDHGFYFGEHGYFGKVCRGVQSMVPYWEYRVSGAKWIRSPMFEEIVNCPLFIYVPGIKAGKYNGLVSAIDLMPTVLDIFQQPVPGWVEGHSLLPALNDTNLKGREYCVSGHTLGTPERRGYSDATITTDEWSLLYTMEPGQSWLYNLKKDPKQENNIIEKNPYVARELHRHFLDFLVNSKASEDLIKPRKDLLI